MNQLSPIFLEKLHGLLQEADEWNEIPTSLILHYLDDEFEQYGLREAIAEAQATRTQLLYLNRQ